MEKSLRESGHIRELKEGPKKDQRYIRTIRGGLPQFTAHIKKREGNQKDQVKEFSLARRRSIKFSPSLTEWVYLSSWQSQKKGGEANLASCGNRGRDSSRKTPHRMGS